jgi:hypothetical protein
MAVAFSREKGIPEWLAVATVIRGWALADSGQIDEGIAEIERGLATGLATGGKLGRTLFLALLAGAYGNESKARTDCASSPRR